MKQDEALNIAQRLLPVFISISDNEVPVILHLSRIPEQLRVIWYPGELVLISDTVP